MAEPEGVDSVQQPFKDKSTTVRHDFPSGDMPTMLAEIERGYGTVEHG